MLPTQAHLDKLLAKAKRIRVIDAGTADGRLSDFTSHGEGSLKTLLEVVDPSDIASFRQVFKIIEPEQSFHCMCRGWPAIEVYAGILKTYRFGLHHGISMRFDDWESDAALATGRALAEWLAARGVKGPLEELDESTRAEAQSKVQLGRWYAAMPRCLVPLQDELLDYPTPDALAHATTALVAGYPVVADRVIALLGWFGAGAGPWSGFPVYEIVPEKLLAEIPLAEIYVIANERIATTAELEGAARLVAMRVRKDAAPMPPALRTKLFAHVEQHAIEDCRNRFFAVVT